MLAVAHPNPWSSASFYLPSQSLADSRCNLHATSRRPTLVVLSLVASSSVASLSSASSCDGAAACRSLALASSPAFRRSSALLAAYFGPSRLSSSPRARMTLLTPTLRLRSFAAKSYRCPGPLSLRTLVPPPMMLALGSPSGASLQLTTGLPLVFRPPRSLLPRLPPVRL